MAFKRSSPTRLATFSEGDERDSDQEVDVTGNLGETIERLASPAAASKPDAISRARQKIKEWEATQKQLEEQIQTLQSQGDSDKGELEQVSALQKKLATVRAKIQKKKDILAGIQRSLTAVLAKRARALEAVESEDALAAVRAKQARLQAARVGLEKEIAALGHPGSYSDSARLAAADLQKELAEVTTEIQRRQAMFAEAQDESTIIFAKLKLALEIAPLPLETVRDELSKVEQALVLKKDELESFGKALADALENLQGQMALLAENAARLDKNLKLYDALQVFLERNLGSDADELRILDVTQSLQAVFSNLDETEKERLRLSLLDQTQNRWGRLATGEVIGKPNKMIPVSKLKATLFEQFPYLNDPKQPGSMQRQMVQLGEASEACQSALMQISGNIQRTSVVFAEEISFLQASVEELKAAELRLVRLVKRDFQETVYNCLVQLADPEKTLTEKAHILISFCLKHKKYETSVQSSESVDGLFDLMAATNYMTQTEAAQITQALGELAEQLAQNAILRDQSGPISHALTLLQSVSQILAGKPDTDTPNPPVRQPILESLEEEAFLGEMATLKAALLEEISVTPGFASLLKGVVQCLIRPDVSSLEKQMALTELTMQLAAQPGDVDRKMRVVMEGLRCCFSPMQIEELILPPLYLSSGENHGLFLRMTHLQEAVSALQDSIQSGATWQPMATPTPPTPEHLMQAVCDHAEYTPSQQKLRTDLLRGLSEDAKLEWHKRQTESPQVLFVQVYPEGVTLNFKAHAQRILAEIAPHLFSSDSSQAMCEEMVRAGVSSLDPDQKRQVIDSLCQQIPQFVSRLAADLPAQSLTKNIQTFLRGIYALIDHDRSTDLLAHVTKRISNAYWAQQIERAPQLCIGQILDNPREACNRYLEVWSEYSGEERVPNPETDTDEVVIVTAIKKLTRKSKLQAVQNLFSKLKSDPTCLVEVRTNPDRLAWLLVNLKDDPAISAHYSWHDLRSVFEDIYQEQITHHWIRGMEWMEQYRRDDSSVRALFTTFDTSSVHGKTQLSTHSHDGQKTTATANRLIQTYRASLNTAKATFKGAQDVAAQKGGANPVSCHLVIDMLRGIASIPRKLCAAVVYLFCEFPSSFTSPRVRDSKKRSSASAESVTDMDYSGSTTHSSEEELHRTGGGNPDRSASPFLVATTAGSGASGPGHKSGRRP